MRGLSGAAAPLASASACTALLESGALDVPRSREGLAAYYRLLSASAPSVGWSAGRWLFDESQGDLQVEQVVVKDHIREGRHMCQLKKIRVSTAYSC